MQKLNSIQAYSRVREGEAVGFISEAYHAENGRPIKMSINAPKDIWLYAETMDEVVGEDGSRRFKSRETVDPETGEATYDTRFIAYVKAGYDQIEFVYTGHFKVTAVGGDFWLNTYEGSNFEVQPTDYESYARVLQREEIDPRVAAMQYEIRLAQRQFQVQMERDRMEYEQRIAALEAAKAPTNVAPTTAAPATAEASTTAVQPTVGGESANAAAGATSGATGGEPNGTAGG